MLEHATTAAAVEAVSPLLWLFRAAALPPDQGSCLFSFYTPQVKKCGDTVACSITAHHLTLVVDDWAGQPFNFCKPVAKYPSDRAALREVIKSGKIQYNRLRTIHLLLIAVAHICRPPTLLPRLRFGPAPGAVKDDDVAQRRLRGRRLHVVAPPRPLRRPA